MNRLRFVSGVLILLSIVLLCSCQRIPLYDRSTEVNLVIDLERTLDHNIVMSVDKPLEKHYRDKIDGVSPAYYEVLVYDINTNALLSTHIVGEKGGSFDLFPGRYHLVVYSFGTESTQVSDLDNMLTARAYTSDITHLKSEIIKSKSSGESSTNISKAYEDDPIIYEPDHLYVANELDVEIESFLGDNESVTVYTTASSILDVYSLEVINVKGVENIEKVDAFVTGQVLSNYFGKQQRDVLPATVYVDMSTDVENKRLYTVFNTFGKLPGANNKIFLDITVTDSGGGQYRYVFDVTEQFDDPGNKDNQLLIDGNIIDIPKAEHGGGGFQPSVNEWEREDIEVPLT